MRSPPATIIHGSDSSDTTYVLGCARVDQSHVWEADRYDDRWRHHCEYQRPVTKKERETEGAVASVTEEETSYPSSTRMQRQVRRTLSITRRNTLGTGFSSTSD